MIGSTDLGNAAQVVDANNTRPSPAGNERVWLRETIKQPGVGVGVGVGDVT